MPSRRYARGHPTRRNVEEPKVTNAPNIQPEGEVTNVEFHESIQILRQAVTNQVG